MVRISGRRLVAGYVVLAGMIGPLALAATAASAGAQAPPPPPSPLAMCRAEPTPGFSFTSLYLGAALFVDLEGSPGDDLMIAWAGMRAVIHGNGGNDTICSLGPSNDTIYGGPGNDKILAGPGGDVIYGGGGNDYIDARNGAVDKIFCGPGHTTVIAEQFDQVAPDCETVIRVPAATPGPAPPTPSPAARSLARRLGRGSLSTGLRGRRILLLPGHELDRR